MAELKMLAIDLGASSGRGIIGSFDGNKLTLESNSWVGGESPRDFDFVGGYAYCTNELTNNVTVLKMNGNGSLDPLPFMYATAPDPLCVIGIAL